jgi:hypothetical protein
MNLRVSALIIIEAPSLARGRLAGVAGAVRRCGRRTPWRRGGIGEVWAPRHPRRARARRVFPLSRTALMGWRGGFPPAIRRRGSRPAARWSLIAERRLGRRGAAGVGLGCEERRGGLLPADAGAAFQSRARARAGLQSPAATTSWPERRRARILMGGAA